MKHEITHKLDWNTEKVLRDLAGAIDKLGAAFSPRQWIMTSSGPPIGHRPDPTYLEILERMVKAMEAKP